MRWVLLALLLTGCAGKEIVREPVEVEVPVAVPCGNEADKPKPVPRAKEFLTIDSEPGEKIKQVLIENKRLRSQNSVLWALLVNCTDQQSKP